LAGGTNARTFLAAHGTRRWVVRIEETGGFQLRRAFAAQQLAERAGVRVPSVLAYELAATEPDDYSWIVEEHVAGAPMPLDPRAFAPGTARALAIDLGRQLRMLHTVAIAEYGLLRPNPYPSFATFGSWIDFETSRIERALRIAEVDPRNMPAIVDVYDFLRDAYHGPSLLCHGDCAGANILASGSSIAALIDWEWARGGDPAWNIAYWAYWHADTQPLDWLLAGYEPDAPQEFRRRLLAYRIFQAVDLILVYDEQGDIAGIGESRRRLEEYLWQRPHKTKSGK
jgi:aminoglycoside phosphotransferase (APT) family kinase protein